VIAPVRRAIEEYLALCPITCRPRDRSFVGQKGGPLSPRIIQYAVEGLRGALGLDGKATPHALRHSFATHLLSRGGELRAIQELLVTPRSRRRRSTRRWTQARLMAAYDSAHPRARAS
jgi:integrase/recombinase XerC